MSISSACMPTASRRSNELPKLMVKLDGKQLGVFEIKAVRGAEDVEEVRVSVEAGTKPLGVSFTNDFYDPKHNARTGIF